MIHVKKRKAVNTIDNLMRELSSKVSEAENVTKYTKGVSILNDLREELDEYERIKSRFSPEMEENELLLDIKKNIEDFGKIPPFYILQYLFADPYTKYPFIIPNYLSETKQKYSVRVYDTISAREKNEDIDIFMRLLTPGSFVYLYGLPVRKSPLGTWDTLSPIRPKYLKSKFIKKIPKDKLPKNVPYSDKAVDLYLPTELKLVEIPESMTKDDFRVCPLCGAVFDGDENCGHSPDLYVKINPPKTYPLIYTYVENMGSRSQLDKIPYPFNKIFDHVWFLKNLTATRFLYGAERSYLGQSWRIYFKPLYGYEMESRGIEFELNSDLVDKIISNIPLDLERNLMILFLINRLTSILFRYHSNIYDARIVIGSILSLTASKRGLPKDSNGVIDAMKLSIKNGEEFKNQLDSITKIYYNDRIPPRFSEIRNKASDILHELLKFKQEDYAKFKNQVLEHTLTHYVYLASMLSIGVDTEDLSVQNVDGKVIIFDDADQGNGCSETLSKLVYIPKDKRAESIRKSRQDHVFRMFSDDMISVLEELIFGCQSAQLGKVYFDIVQSKGIEELSEFIQNPEKLQELGFSEAITKELYNFIKQPPYVHKIIKAVDSYEKLWIYQIFPEILYLMKEKEVESVERVIDASALCIDGCPNCIFLDRCNYGLLFSRYFLSRNFVEYFYEFLISKSTLDLDIDEEGEISKKIIEEYGVLYVRCSRKKLKLAFNFIGKLLSSSKYGKPYLSHIWVDPLGYMIKMTFERGSNC